MRTVELLPDRVRMIDQRRLPAELVHLELTDHRGVAEAIRSLAVRGAPAIGVTAAFGLVLAARELAADPAGIEDEADAIARLEIVAEELRRTRPTAVNLFWAIDRMLDKARAVAAGAFAQSPGDPGGALRRIADALTAEAQAMADEDVATNRAIGRHGQALLPDGAGVLTHCNTGSLACVDYGTALGVIRAAHGAGKGIHVYVDETRPVLQGARLTAWELVQDGIPATLITDNMAGWLMRQGRVQAVIVGADRVAANGDVANKIGTYGLAVLAKEHGIPFYVAAPVSTIDLQLPSGEQIPIEQRRGEEVTHPGGVRVAPDGIAVWNPAFDVTPGDLISAIVTDRGVLRAPYRPALAALLDSRSRSERGGASSHA